MKTKPPTLTEYLAELGRRGGLARAKKLSAERLSEIGKMGAAAARQKKKDK